MTIQLSTVFTDNLLSNDVATAFGVAAQIGGGSLVVYSGTKPATADSALSGNTVLATFAISAAASQGLPAAGSFTLAFGALTVAVTAAGTNTATFFRILNAGGACLIQGTVGVSSADFNLSSVSLSLNDNVTITLTPSIALPIT